jgi:hypothetical protein
LGEVETTKTAHHATSCALSTHHCPTGNQESTMTAEEKARIRELPKLIADENDFAKMKVIATELVRLLTLS